MKARQTKHSSLFLMELLIAILFFILASAICVNFFVQSHLLEQDSINLNHATNAATSAAEIFLSEESPSFEKFFCDGNNVKNGYLYFYDENWELCDSSQAKYTVFLQWREDDTIRTCHINVSSAEESLYALTVKKHVTKEAL